MSSSESSELALAETLREAGEKAAAGPWEEREVSIPAGTTSLGSPARTIYRVEPNLLVTDKQAVADLIVTLRNNLPTIISALERAAAAEGEKAKAWDEGWEAARADVWNRKDEGTYRITPNPYRSAS